MPFPDRHTAENTARRWEDMLTKQVNRTELDIEGSEQLAYSPAESWRHSQKLS
jgi:hypothetical protein